MKILYILDHKPTLSETFITNEINSIQQNFHEINLNVFTIRENPLSFTLASFKNMLDFSTYRESLTLPLKLLKLVSIIEEFKPDIIHCHYASAPASVGLWLSKRYNIPYGFTCHARDLFVDAKNLRKKIEKAEYVICISEYNRNYIYENFGRIDNKIYVNYLGVEIPKLPRINLLHKDNIQICTIARSVKKKGVDNAIQMTAYLNEMGYNTTLHYIGNGPEYNNLVKLSTRCGMKGKVIFYGALSNNEAMNILEQCSLFVLLALIDSQGDRDGIPVSFMEAMARGIPVIATAISGIPEIVRNAENGFLVEPDNFQNIENIISQIIQDKKLYETLSINSYNTIKEKFDLKTNIKRLVEILKESSL
ncbi:MAG: glycosyltransferase family 4 protein [Candidatus Hydrogenedentota bacterium]